MSQYNSLRATIDANIKTNNNEEITGAILNSVLNEMVATLGAGFQFMGVATPTNPGSNQTPDYKCFYLATTPGTYTHLGGLVVNAGEVVFLKYDASWIKEVTGIASAPAIAALNTAIQSVDSAAISRDTALGGRIDAQNAEISQFEDAVRDQVDNYPMVTIEGNVTNAPDGEDLTTEDNKLKFANRSALFGKGYFILRRGNTFAEQVTLQNTIYEIRYNFDLGGASVTIPTGCVLKFVGGSLSNGEIVIKQDTIIEAQNVKIFDAASLTISVETEKSATIKYAIHEINAAWFGAIGDNTTDNYAAIQKAVDCADNIGCPVVIPKGRYKVSQTIELYSGSVLTGDSENIQNTSNKNSTILDYGGAEGSSCLHCTAAEFVSLRNIGITNSTNYVCDGFAFDDSLILSEFNNCLFHGCRYGIYGVMGVGFSRNRFERLQIVNCVKGIFVDSPTLASQYITLNMFKQLTISRCKESAIEMVAATINSLNCEDCNIASVGYSQAYDSSGLYKNHSAIILNQTGQGSALFHGCYFENVIYSPDGTEVAGYDYASDAVISINKTALTFVGCRFANTLRLVKSAGQDRIVFINCIDNGFLFPATYYTALVTLLGVSDIIIRGFQIYNKGKDIIAGSLNSSNYKSTISIRGFMWKNGVQEDDSEYNHQERACVYIGSAVGSGLLSRYPTTPSLLPEIYLRDVRELTMKYVEDVVTESSNTIRNNKYGTIKIFGNGFKHTISSNAANYTCVYDLQGFRNADVSDLNWEGNAGHPYFLRTDTAVETTFHINRMTISALYETGRLVVLSASANVQHVEITNVDNQSGKAVNTSNSHFTSVDMLFGNTNVTKFSDVHAGTTANRPTSVPVGHRYFDETLGYPIWWDGTQYVDASGNPV